MSSVTSQTRGVLEPLTRAGFIGYGVLHLLFAYVIVQIALGGAGADGDQSGAMQKLADEPFGTALIVAIVVGLVAMALWQLLELFVVRHVRERIASAGRVAFYLYLGWNGVKVLRGKSASSADTQQDAAAGLLGLDLGRVAVILAGLVVAGVGVGLAVAGLTRRFERHLRKVPPLVRRLGVIGFTAKGLAYGIAGVLFVVAAIRFDPEKARGLDAALRALAGQAYGPVLLIVTAAGFVAYGLFSVAEARYRKI
jgi:hypothetical protein